MIGTFGGLVERRCEWCGGRMARAGTIMLPEGLLVVCMACLHNLVRDVEPGAIARKGAQE